MGDGNNDDELIVQEEQPMVRRSDGFIVPWDRNSIVKQLLTETKLAKEFYDVRPMRLEEAAEIAADVERKVFDLKLKFVSGPLIRELVNNVLLDKSKDKPEYAVYRNVLTRVGTPIYDAYLIDFGRGFKANENANLQPNAETSHKRKADWVSDEEYLLLMPPKLADAHLAGDLHIHDLEYFGTRPFCQDWDLRYFFYYGLMPDGMGTRTSVAGPAKHPEVAVLHTAKILASAQTNFAGGEGFYNFLVFLAPYMKGSNYERIKQMMQMMFFEYTQAYVARGGQLVFSNIQVQPGVPELWRKVPVVARGRVGPDVYGDYEDEVRLMFKALYEVALQGDYRGKPFNFPKLENSISPEFFKPEYDEFWLDVHRVVAKFGTPYFDNLMPRYRGYGKGVSCYQCIPADETVIAEVDGNVVVDAIQSIYKSTCASTKPVKAYGFDSRTMKVGFYLAKGIMEKRYSGRLYTVMLETGRKITVTADHPCYVFSKGHLTLKKACELLVGDYLPVLKEMPLDEEVVELDLLRMFSEAKIENIIVRNGRINVPNAKKEGIPQKIPVTPELARLIGYYLAEGDGNKRCFVIRFSFNKNETHLINDVQYCLKTVFGLVGNVYELKTAKVLQVGSKPLFHFFVNVLKMGHNSDTKRVPNIAYAFPKDMIAHVLSAFFYGDGNVDTRKRQTQIRLAHQSSKSLVQGLVLTGLRIGIPMNYNERRGYCEAKITSRELVERFIQVTHLQEQLIHDLPSTARSFVYDVYPIEQLGIQAGQVAYTQLMNVNRVGSKLLTLDEDSLAFKVMKSSVHPLRVISITENCVEDIMVYDFVDVEDAHTFSNGLGVLTHNCCAYCFVETAENNPEFEEKMNFVGGKHFTMGSWQVISLNLPRMAYKANGDDDRLFEETCRLMDLSVEIFEIKNKWMNLMLKQNRVPFATQRPLDPRTGERGPPAVDFDELVFTLGLVGGNEMAQWHTGYQLHEHPEAIKILVKLILEMQKYKRELEQTSSLKLALARTPAESTAQRFAVADLLTDAYRSNAEKLVKGDLPKAMGLLAEGERDVPVYYNNGTHVYIGANISLLERIEIEQKFFPLLNGGNMLHVWLGEASPDPEALYKLTKRIATQTHVGYYAYTKDLTICNGCGQVTSGINQNCPHCGSSNVEWWSRVTGYYQAVSGWNEGKKQELHDRYRVKV